MLPLTPVGENPSLPLSSFWWFAGSTRPSSACAAASPCVVMWRAAIVRRCLFSSYEGVHRIGLEPIWMTSFLTWSQLQRRCFQIRSGSQILDILGDIGHLDILEDTVQLIITLKLFFMSDTQRASWWGVSLKISNPNNWGWKTSLWYRKDEKAF